MNHFLKSLRFKVTLLVITVELLIFSGLGVFYTHRFSQEIDNTIIARLSIPGLLMTRGELSFDAVSDQRTMEGLLREPYREGIVIGLDGLVYFSSDPALLDTRLDAVDGLRLPGPESAPVSVDAPDLITPVQDSTGTYLTCLSPLRPDGKLTGYLYLKVGTGISEAEKRKVALLFFIGSLVTIALTAAILSWLLHLTVIRRLNDLVEIFRRFARGDYAARAQPLDDADEIATLMNGFNGLAERLEDTVAHLSESESRFRVLVEHAPEAIVVYDVDTKLYVDANHNAERLFACSLERLQLSSPTDFFAPVQPDPTTVEQSVARALTGEEVVLERAITNAGGQQLLCEVRLVLLPASNRRLIRASYIDITARKRAEEALRENQHFLETLLEHIPNMLFVKDARTLTFLRFNTAGEKLLGYSRDELLGKNDYDFFPKEQADFFTSKDREIIDSGDLLDIPEEPIDTRYWGQRLLHTRKIPIYADGGSPLYLLGISEDITDRKKAEEELSHYREHLEERVRERTAELEAANREMHAFTYTVSHDLRAPLRHIDGFIGLLRKTIGTALDQQSRHYMDSISNAAQKMGLLIDDLLAFSRMGRHDMSFKSVKLGHLVRDVIAELESDAAGRDIDWRIGEFPKVSGDAALLRMVMANLIANALKFTRSRQQAQIEIGCMPDAETETVIFVRDNGVGFDMTYADKLFGVFQRLHRADEFEGNGIGLATVRRIINRHGGRTWAEGKPDRGAVLYFSLPKASGAG